MTICITPIYQLPRSCFLCLQNVSFPLMTNFNFNVTTSQQGEDRRSGCSNGRFFRLLQKKEWLKKKRKKHNFHLFLCAILHVCLLICLSVSFPLCLLESNLCLNGLLLYPASPPLPYSPHYHTHIHTPSEEAP